jgi:O-antigen/teichoic acid export membrane protein
MLIEEAGSEIAGLSDIQEQSPLGLKIMRSVAFGALRYVFLIPIPFVMTPLILRKIGTSGYGTWAIFLAINGLTSMADLGMVGTLSKFVAEYHATRNMPALTRVLNAGFGLYLLLDVVIGIGLWSVSPLLAGRFFRGSPMSSEQLIVLLHFFLIVVAANILTQPLASVTTGLQRLDLTNIISTGNVLMSSVLGGILLLRGWGLKGLIYGYCLSAVLTVVTYIGIVRRLLPNFKLNPLQFHRGEAKKMFGFSLRLYIVQAAGAINNQVEKFYLGILVGVGAVGWYDIASDVALKLRNGLSFLLAPVLPAASELNALGDESRMQELFYRSHKYLALLGVPAVCYVIVISSRFVELWLGPGLEIIALPLSILLLVSFVNLATGPAYYVYAGSGNLRLAVQAASLGAVVNIVFSLGFIYKLGFAGAVLGTSTSLILSAVFFSGLFHRRTGYSIWRVLQEGYLRAALCSVPTLAVLLTIFRPKQMSWYGLVGFGVCFAVLYAVLILFSRFFDEYDLTKLESFLPFTRHARKIIRRA